MNIRNTSGSEKDSALCPLTSLADEGTCATAVDAVKGSRATSDKCASKEFGQG
jgi:hypothetical protein